MTAPRRVVVTIRNAAANRTAFEAGALFARLFRAPLHGLFVDEPTLEDLCGLPAPFQPGGRSAAPLRPSMMRIAAERAARRLSAELERTALRAQLSLTVSRIGGPVREAVVRGAASGDLLLLSADLSDRPSLASTVDLARAAARACNVLIVPERSPRGAGAVLAIAADPADPAAAMARELARGLGTHVVTVAPRATNEPAGHLIPEGQDIRLIVGTRAGLEGADLEGTLARERLSVLIMADGGDAKQEG